MAAASSSPKRTGPRVLIGWACLALGGVIACNAGCNKEILKFSKDDDKNTPRLIAGVAGAFGLEPLEVMGYGIVGGLPGTGGNIPPGTARSEALRMLKQKMDDGQAFLASKEAAVVLVRAQVPPGVRQGSTFDVEIRCLDEDRQTTSLRGGILLACTLNDVADVSQLSANGQNKGPNLRTGKEWATAGGPVVVGMQDGQDTRKGRILSGGTAKKERPLALIIKGEYTKKADTAAKVGRAIDERFRVQSTGDYSRIADAKRPDYVTLRVPDVYKHNLQRYLDVIQRIPFEIGNMERVAWQRQCAEDLNDPAKCFEAALCLEGLGAETGEILNKAKTHAHPKIRFAASEALAYLGRAESADVLAQIALTSPEMRPYALAALAVVDDTACITRLRELMACDSAETRCGAFVALRTNHPQDLGLKGVACKEGGFILYQVAPKSLPMVHVATTGKPEIVLFGEGQSLLGPFSLNAGPDLVVTAQEGQADCTITRTEVGAQPVKQRCSLQLGEVIVRLSQMGATYPDVADLLRQAANGKNISGKFVVDGLPRLIPWSDLARAEVPVQ